MTTVSSDIYAEKDNRTLSVCAFLVAVIIFFRCMPFYIWSVESTVRSICAILLPVVSFRYLDRLTNENWLYILLFVTSYLITALVFTASLLSFINRILLIFIPLMQPYFIRKSFQYFKSIFCVFLLLGIIEHFLSILGIIHPLGIITPLNELKVNNYYVYMFSARSLDFANELFPRFSGVFDEPGVIGTICGLILFISHGRFESWKDYTILVAGILSFSMFFYAMLVFIPFLNGTAKNRIIGLFLVLTIALLVSNIPALYELIGNRFDIQEGVFAGDNRYNEKTQDIIFYDVFSHDFWWGHGVQSAEQFAGQSSMLIFGYREGFAFVLINLIAYIIMGYKHIFHASKINFIIFCVIIFGTFYQRPGFYNPEFIFLMTILSYQMANTNNNVYEETISHGDCTSL